MLTKSEEEVGLQTPVIKISSQERKQHQRYSPPKIHVAFALYSIENDPRIVKEAFDSTKGELWKKAMEEEIESLRKNETWDLVTLPD